MPVRMGRKPRGNPNWGRGKAAMARAGPTEFERLIIDLGLRNELQMQRSRRLRNWASKNRNRRYIPEELLSHWGIDVDVDLSPDLRTRNLVLV